MSANALCRLLTKNATLRRIDLAGNDFEGCGEAIREALWRNANLHDLRLLSCGLSEDVLLSIDEALVRREEDRETERLLSG